MTNLTLIRESLEDDSKIKLKTILKPWFDQKANDTDLNQADLIALLNSETDPQRIYKLSSMYIKQWKSQHK